MHWLSFLRFSGKESSGMNNVYLRIPGSAKDYLRLIRKTAKSILIFLLLSALMSCAVTLISNHGDFTKMNVFGFRLSIALSQSMEPTILTDAICLTDMRPQEYKIGDIIVFRHFYAEEQINALICHRIIEITPGGRFITKGDNNEEEDPWETSPEDIMGKVIWAGNFFARI